MTSLVNLYLQQACKKFSHYKNSKLWTKFKYLPTKGLYTEHFTDLGKLKLLTYGGSILGSSQFTLLPQLPLKMTLNLKVVKIDSEIFTLLH